MNPQNEMLTSELKTLRSRHDGVARGITAGAAELAPMLAGIETPEEVEALALALAAAVKMLDRPTLTRAKAVAVAMRALAHSELSRRALVADGERLELERVAALE